MALTDYILVLTEAERRALILAVDTPRRGGRLSATMANILHKLNPEGLPPAQCPCKDPVPLGSTPCSPDDPCPYAKGRIADLWRA